MKHKATYKGCAGKRIKDFFIACVPPRTTHQSGQTIMRGRNGARFVGQNAKAKAVAEELQLRLLPHVPTVKFTKPTRLHIVWQYPFRKSEPQKNRQLGIIPCTVRPDADNLAKLFLDAMNKVGFFKDDALVYDLRLIKTFAYNSGIKVRIEEIDINAETGGMGLVDC